MKLVANKFKSGGLHEKYVASTWNFVNHLSICSISECTTEQTNEQTYVLSELLSGSLEINSVEKFVYSLWYRSICPEWVAVKS